MFASVDANNCAFQLEMAAANRQVPPLFEYPNAGRWSPTAFGN
jgi:hypothetical protein